MVHRLRLRSPVAFGRHGGSAVSLSAFVDTGVSGGRALGEETSWTARSGVFEAAAAADTDIDISAAECEPQFAE